MSFEDKTNTHDIDVSETPASNHDINFEQVKPGLDFFSTTGYRLMAVEMLIESVQDLKKFPDSETSEYQKNWLLGIEDAGLITGTFCIEAVAGDGVDIQEASIKFLAAAEKDPDGLLRALQNAKTRIRNGEECVAEDPDRIEEYIINHPAVSAQRQRQAG